MGTSERLRADPIASLGDRSFAAGLAAVALRRLRDREDALDAVQETLVRALVTMRDGASRPAVRIPAFAVGIARHVIADTVRRRRRDGRRSVNPDGLESPAASALDALIRAEERSRLSRAMAGLRASDRRLLERCFVDGMTVADIARRLGEPAGRIRKRKSRALGRLRNLLADGPPSGRAGFRAPAQNAFIDRSNRAHRAGVLDDNVAGASHR